MKRKSILRCETGPFFLYNPIKTATHSLRSTVVRPPHCTPTMMLSKKNVLVLECFLLILMFVSKLSFLGSVKLRGGLEKSGPGTP